MNPQWKRDDLEAEHKNLLAAIAALDAELEQLGRWRDRAEARWGEHCATLQRITNDQIALKVAVSARGIAEGPDGRPFSGPTLAERDRYQALERERAEAERQYQAWVAEARIAATDGGGLDRSWSRRHPSDLARRIKTREIQRGHCHDRRRQVEDELARLQPAPATEAADAEQRGLVDRLRARLG